MNAPFQPTGIDHIVIWVRGLEKAREWYARVLGCRDGFEYPEIAMSHMWYGPVLIGLWDADDPKARYARTELSGVDPNVHHIAFGYSGATENEIRAHLQNCGVKIVRELRQTGAHGFGLALYFRDPWDSRVRERRALL